MGENEIQFSLKRKDGRRRQWKWIGHVMNNNNNNNIFSLIKRLTNALRCTFTCYAIETILTTSRTDSLQYNGANSSLQSISAQRGLELGTSRSLCQMLSNAPLDLHY